MSELPPAGIAPADWDATPAAVRAVVLALLTHLAALTTEVRDLRAQLNQHSQNSSKPPSSDPPSAPQRPTRAKTGRKAGGQPGHQGHSRPLLPEDQVDEVVPCYPTQCPSCQGGLPASLPDSAPITRTQVWEIPPIVPHVTEYQQHTVDCPACHARVQGQRPPDAPPGGYGARATALTSLLHGRLRLSERESATTLTDICGLPISLGSVVRCCERVSDALAPVYTALQTVVQQQRVVNMDETSWKEATVRHWLWTVVSALATVFLIVKSRGGGAIVTLLGEAFGGVVGSDRHRPYGKRAAALRQICWSHLDRNFQALADYGHPDSGWATTVLAQIDALFRHWYAFREGRTDRGGLQAALIPIQAAIHEALEAGQQIRWHRIQAISSELLLVWPALWTFAHVEGVEPTNNAAERALRPAVLWRKGCFGTRSAEGSRFVERMLTVSATCAQQERHLLTFLTEAVEAHWSGRPAPVLVPLPTP
jgi:transposase